MTNQAPRGLHSNASKLFAKRKWVTFKPKQDNQPMKKQSMQLNLSPLAEEEKRRSWFKSNGTQKKEHIH